MFYNKKGCINQWINIDNDSNIGDEIMVLFITLFKLRVNQFNLRYFFFIHLTKVYFHWMTVCMVHADIVSELMLFLHSEGIWFKKKCYNVEKSVLFLYWTHFDPIKKNNHPLQLTFFSNHWSITFNEFCFKKVILVYADQAIDIQRILEGLTLSVLCVNHNR